MLRNLQAKAILLSGVMMMGAFGCSNSKQSEDQAESGTTGKSGSATSDTSTGDKTSTDGTSPSGDTGNVPAAAFNIPELIGKMTWGAEIYNNSAGKIFTGFNGTNPFA